MHRTAFALVLAAALAPGAELSAQDSDNSGFMVGVHLTGSTIGTTGRGTQLRSGPGAGIKVGYGFSERIALYFGLDAAEIGSDAGEGAGDGFVARSSDLGARVSFGEPSHALRPYLVATTTAVSLGEAAALFGFAADQEPSGGGLSVGIGAQYFVRRPLALDAAFHVTTGSFRKVTAEGESSEIPGVPFQYGRLQLGLTWHP